MIFQDMALMILKKYNSDDRQQKVKRILDMLRLGKFMSERDLNYMKEGLKKLVSHIDDLASQSLPYASYEGKKI